MRLPHGPPPILVAIGIGGRLELTANHIRLVKGGIFGHLFELLWLGTGISDKSIAVREISSVEIVKPILLPDFIRFSYDGSPPGSGRYIEDVLAENALIMNLVDHRAFYAIKDWIDRWPASLVVAESTIASAVTHATEDAGRHFR